MGGRHVLAASKEPQCAALLLLLCCCSEQQTEPQLEPQSQSQSQPEPEPGTLYKSALAPRQCAGPTEAEAVCVGKGRGRTQVRNAKELSVEAGKRCRCPPLPPCTSLPLTLHLFFIYLLLSFFDLILR